MLQGKKNPGTDRYSVESFLRQVLEAKEMKIDRLALKFWSITIETGFPFSFSFPFPDTFFLMMNIKLFEA